MATQPDISETSHASSVDGRRNQRVSVRLSAVLKCDRTPTQQIIVVDINRSGCVAIIKRQVNVGTFVTHAIPTYVDVFGWVVWSDDRFLGIDFSHALPPAVLAHILTLGPAPDPKAYEIRTV